VKRFIILISLLLNFLGCKSSEGGRDGLTHNLKLIGIPPEIVVNVCQDSNDNGSCDIGELQAKITVNKSDTVAQMWEKVEFDAEGRYILENYDPTKSIIMEIQDEETLKYDNSKLALRYNPDSEELSVLQALIDADFLTEDDTKELKALDNREEVDKILFDSLRVNQNLLRDENLSSKNALAINLEEIAKGLIEANVTKELPAQLNACSDNDDCIKEIVNNTVKEVELTKEEAQELARSKRVVDAYIIKLLKPVEAVCANGKTYKSLMDVGEKGKITFDKFPVGTKCTITVFSGATIDSNNNGKLDSDDKLLAFDMSGSSDDTHITPLTTLLVKKSANGENVERFKEMIQNFDPVTAPNRVVTNQGIEKVKIEKLIVLVEVLKASMKQFTDISKITLSQIVTTKSSDTLDDLNIDKLIENLPEESKENVLKRATSTKKLVTMLKDLDPTKISLNDFFVAFSDGGKGIEDALTQALFVPLPEGVSILDFIIKPRTNEENAIEEQDTVQSREDIKNEFEQELIAVNIPPISNAGEDRTLFIGETITLDGSKSTDSDGTIDSYTWWESEKLLDSGVSITLDDLAVGIHVITLLVKDDQGEVAIDTVIITVKSKEVVVDDENIIQDDNITLDNEQTENNVTDIIVDDNNTTDEGNTTDNNLTSEVNQAPIANAGEDQNVTEGDTVTFDGSKSTDSDGSIVAYEWKDDLTVIGTDASFESSDLEIGVHTITLTVTDDKGLKSSDEVVITVNKKIIPNKKPIANAGDDQNVTEGDTITFDGSKSSDSDGSIVAYEWKDGSTVIGSDASFESSDLSVGVHTIVLTVTDDKGLIASDEVVVTVNEKVVPNQAPIANAGADQTVTEGDMVYFDGSASLDSDGDIVAYEWKNGSTVVSNSVSFSSNDLYAGTYTITLTVTDDKGLTGRDEVIITVKQQYDNSTN
jgi:hypothetical protein